LKIDNLDQNRCAKYFWIRLQSGQDSAGVMQRKIFRQNTSVFCSSKLQTSRAQKTKHLALETFSLQHSETSTIFN
jgi:hypothetical protein